jgi:hypothetical protein
VNGERRAGFQVCNLDRDGAYLFVADNAEVADFLPNESGNNEKMDLVFRFRDREIRCAGTPVSRLSRAAGGGFQFRGLSPDAQKDIGDFIETLRGEGYAD